MFLFAVCRHDGNLQISFASYRDFAALAEPLTLVLPQLACRGCQVWFTRPIWMWSDHQFARICTWTEEEKKKKMGISSDWNPIMCQRSRWRKSEVLGNHFTHMADLHHMASKKKKNPMEQMVRFFHSLHFLPSLSLSQWPLTSLTLAVVQHLLYN